MALCLMYLTDTDSTVGQATNASLTKLIRLQTQVISGECPIESSDIVHASLLQVRRRCCLQNNTTLTKSKQATAKPFR